MSDLALDQLRTLVAVVSEGTFESAAAALSITPSAVSQRIKALETATGRILVRRTRPVRATEHGEEVLRVARQVVMLLHDLASDVDGDAEPPPIPLVVNADSLATWFLPSVAAVTDRVRLDVQREDEQHSLARLREGAALAAVSAVGDRVPGCSVTPLGTMRYRAVASPEFVARWFPDGATQTALAHAPVVEFDRLDDLQQRFLRRTAGRDAAPPRHYVPGSEAFREAVRLGLGWGMLPDLQSAQLRADRAVTEISPSGTIDVRLFWHQYQLDSPALALLSDAVAAGARERLH